MKKIRSSQPATPVLNRVRQQSFPVSIVKKFSSEVPFLQISVSGHGF